MTDMPTPEYLTGTVEAVCMSPDHGFPTYPQDRVSIYTYGIPGDAHSGPMRASFRNPGTTKPNDRPISIVGAEVYDAMNEEFDLKLGPGSFNEQVTVRGFGDLRHVGVGRLVLFSSGVHLEVVDLAWPCTKLAAFCAEPRLVKALVTQENDQRLSRRGILAKVLQTGDLSPGDSVRII